MFYETKIGKLSKVQKSNLKKGKSVRIKKGSADILYLTEKQVKGLDKNSKLGKAYTIKLSPEQISKSGIGIISDLVGLVHPTAGKIASIAGLGVAKKKTKSGKGLISDLVGIVHPTAGKLASIAGLGMMEDLATSAMFSAGVHNKVLAPRKSGNGFLQNLAKEAAINIAKSAGKFAVDKGSNFIKDKIEGMGRARRLRSPSAKKVSTPKGRAIKKTTTPKGRAIKKLSPPKFPMVSKTAAKKTTKGRAKKKATPAQLAALAKGRAIRDAKRRKGGALYPA
jgi:hypothetical protein